MIDLTGQSFSDLVALHPTDKRQYGNVVWACRCICGRLAEVSANRLRFSITKSCGCRKGRVTTTRNVTSSKHGHMRGNKPSPTYRAWRSMIARCEDSRHRNYPFYGGRGFRVNTLWRDSFEAFLADMGVRPDGRTLDRKEPDLGYNPGNCRWATDDEQASNRRSNVYLSFNGETLTMAAWARRLGCKPSALRMRLAKGWLVDRALTEPFGHRSPRKIGNPVPRELREAMQRFRQNYKHLKGDLTFDEWQVVLKEHDHCCHYCNHRKPLTMDHVIPLSRGGPHTRLNVVPACRSCNSSKQANGRYVCPIR